MTINSEIDLTERLAKIEAEVKIGNLQNTALSKSLDDLKYGIAKRIEDYGERIPVLEDRVNDIRSLIKILVTGIIIQIIGGIAWLAYHH